MAHRSHAKRCSDDLHNLAGRWHRLHCRVHFHAFRCQLWERLATRAVGVVLVIMVPRHFRAWRLPRRCIAVTVKGAWRRAKAVVVGEVAAATVPLTTVETILAEQLHIASVILVLVGNSIFVQTALEHHVSCDV